MKQSKPLPEAYLAESRALLTRTVELLTRAKMCTLTSAEEAEVARISAELDRRNKELARGDR